MVPPKYVKRFTLYFDVFLVILNAPSLIADTFCGRPPEVKNGEALVEAFNTEFPVGTNIGYSCHDGFILNTIGSSYAVCLSDNDTAFWQPAVISCEQNITASAKAQYLFEFFDSVISENNLDWIECNGIVLMALASCVAVFSGLLAFI
ncbi:sushi domain-containing protein [Nephila pilipes]|uniref:Sushi domain-containing protein n=1 Tax=Nephila pilipes TaxID=299642 RepID=A0A8X6U4C0_NEPPI|nr:sushi domain-containing protein [Nephila pilipes]